MDQVTPMAHELRGELRGRSYCRLYAAAKQLVDNHPKRFPYLEQEVKHIEALELAPPLERTPPESHYGQ
jgi:hypothetical protein